jgi:anaerobic magnesium-protoporphyrin IX monomethyl ester cyclase
MKRKIILLSDVRGVEGDNILYMPLSIMAIGTVLKSIGFEPTLIDVQVEPRWTELLRHHLDDALLFGVSSLTGPSIFSVLEGINIAKQHCPEVPIVWGGYHATQAYRSIFDEGLVDYVIYGPGEEAVAGLSRVLYEYKDSAFINNRLKNVPNLIYRDGSNIVVNPYRIMPDVNELASMDYELIDVYKYFNKEYQYIQYVSSYGCPYSCTFCAEPAQSSKKWKGFMAERFVDEVSFLWRKYQPQKIYLVDANYSSNPKRVVEIVEEMQRRKAYVKVLCDMRAGDILRIAERTDLKKLKEVGFEEIFIGLETGSDRMLNLLKKNLKSSDGLKACRMLAESGIEFCTSFIHDFPMETVEDSDQTFELIEKLCQLQGNTQSHHFYTPYPATEMYSQLLTNSNIREEKKQTDWARTSTFYGSDLWSGRMPFRRNVLRRLLSLHREYPTHLPKTNLPVLRPIKVSGFVGS